MAKYCDTKQLESVWGEWLFVEATPELNRARESKCLWMKPLDNRRVAYCIALSHPFHFIVVDQKVGSEARRILTDPLQPDAEVARTLSIDNYIQDKPTKHYWDQLVSMVYSVCMGLALKFNPTTEEERFDLAHEALKQALAKIQSRKLRFEPGRAPVFNLLTTAVIRIMYSIKNKEKRRRLNQSKFTSDIICGKQMPQYRSLRVSRSGASADHTVKAS